jgi:hypothetical protein
LLLHICYTKSMLIVDRYYEKMQFLKRGCIFDS